MRALQKNRVIFILAFFFFTGLHANPFLSTSSPTEETEQTERESLQFENARQGQVEKEEGKPKAAPQIRLGQTSEKNLEVQRGLRETLGNSFYEWKALQESGNTADQKKAESIFWTILAAAFAFGLFHALGPGHRKTIVFSLYISRKAAWWEPLAVALSLSALHAGSAIVLILFLNGITGSISARADTISKWMEGLSYIILILSAIALLSHSIVEQISYAKKTKAGTNKSEGRKNISLSAFIFSGIYPCPGAVLVLILSFTLNIIKLGITSVLVMSLGMSIPILISAYIAWAGREGLFYFFKNKEGIISKLSFIIELLGYALLLAFSFYIAWPFLIGLLR